MRIVLSLLIAAAAAAGCAPRAEPPVAPVRPVTPPPAPPRPAPAPAPLSSDWRDWPIAPGSWRYARDARGPVAAFGTGAVPDFTIRCDRGGNAVYLSRRGDARGTGFTIRTTTSTRALPTQAAPDGAPYIAAVLGPDDRLLDAIGFSRGRFVVEAPPLAPLAIPAWPEILRVIEDCRG